jgi:hypothetical protein
MPDFIDTFAPDLDPSIDDMQKLYDMEVDELLRSDLVEILDQRDAARALFDKASFILDDVFTPLPPPTLANLLATFELEQDYANKQGAVLWQGVHDAAADAHDDVSGVNPVAAGQLGTDPSPTVDAAVKATGAVLDAVTSASAAAVDALSVPKDAVHVSDSAILFKDWHIKDFPTTEYIAPYFLDITDPTIVANIKKARDMLPKIQHGDQGSPKPQNTGVMAWVEFTNGKKMQGWMYVESKGPYQDYFWAKVQSLYDAAKADADAKIAADPVVAGSPRAVSALRANQRIISACQATFRQEGLPPAINTYDGTVLTWCSGLAAPGALNKIFVALNQDANCRKVMYLCGFLFTGTVSDGEFQIADVESDPPRVYYQNNFASMDYANPDTGKVDPNRKKGSRDYHAYRVLEHFTSQLPLIYMLIALSRDELTRDKVFDPNMAAMISMVTVAGAENIATEALHTFIGEVQHNWSLTSRQIATPLVKDKQNRPSNIVQWAIAHFTDDERNLDLPSEDGDRAIAKGIFRFTLRAIQEDALNVALVFLRIALRQQNTDRLADGILLSTIATLYGFQRLMDNYWKPMQTGKGPAGFTPHSIDGSTLTFASDFPVRLGDKDAANAGDPDVQLVQDHASTAPSNPPPGTPPPPVYYAIGTKEQCEFICPNDVALLGMNSAGDVIVKDQKTNEEYVLHRDGRTREWSRV